MKDVHAATSDVETTGDLRVVRDESRTLHDAIDERRDQCAEILDKCEPATLPPTDHVIELHHADGDVGIYATDGTWLACEETLEEALQEAAMKVRANRNRASWAAAEIEQGRRHLQEQHPELAAQVGL